MSAVIDADVLIEALADQMTASGYLTDQSWRPVLHAVPRHLFAPARAYASPGTADGPPDRVIDRDADPADWWAAVYDNTAIVTQRDDGAADLADDEARPTCSVSAPCVVLPFLNLLGARPGDRLLEVGTGTGWTAGLLSERIGPDSVTSLEVDPALAVVARENLARAGYAPTVADADGLRGCPGETFDRLHVTCGIITVPWAWIEQLRPGGVAVLPWQPDGWNGYKVRLTAGDGYAAGTFHGPAGFMVARAQRPTSNTMIRTHHASEADVTSTSLDPGDVAAHWGERHVALQQVPGLVFLSETDDDGLISILLGEAGHLDGSWAACDFDPSGKHVVTQYGRRRLWDELEMAYRAWLSAGQPGEERYRLLVTPEGQRVVLDEECELLVRSVAAR